MAVFGAEHLVATENSEDDTLRMVNLSHDEPALIRGVCGKGGGIINIMLQVGIFVQGVLLLLRINDILNKFAIFFHCH